MRLLEPITKMSMKIDLYYQVAEMYGPMTLVYGNIRFMRIFAGFLWKGGVKRQRGNRKRRFSGLQDAVFDTLGNEANIIIQYYLVPCRLSSDPNTLNDPDWPFRDKFCFRAGLAG